jgi:hypothetical protein
MSLEWKELEGQRIGAALGAVGALPAAALVVGKEVGPASPFFALALVAVVAAYLFWMFTDSIYHLSMAPIDEDELLLMRRRGTPLSYACFGYGAASLLLSLFGLAAMHAGLRTTISVSDGFIVVFSVSIVILVHCFLGMRTKNQLWHVARAAVLRARVEAVES